MHTNRAPVLLKNAQRLLIESEREGERSLIKAIMRRHAERCKAGSRTSPGCTAHTRTVTHAHGHMCTVGVIAPLAWLHATLSGVHRAVLLTGLTSLLGFSLATSCRAYLLPCTTSRCYKSTGLLGFAHHKTKHIQCIDHFDPKDQCNLWLRQTIVNAK